MTVPDSRRLTGPNIVGPRPGAVLDVVLEDGAGDLVDAWRRAARRMLDAVGWEDEEIAVRWVRGGASLVISAPIDALYAATEVTEWAWSEALQGPGDDDSAGFEAARRRLATIIEQERRPATLALRAAARQHGVTFLADDDRVSIGLGSGARCWAVDRVPGPEEIDWSGVHDVPVVLVTGCNGKTTSVRLLAAVAREAGLTPGLSSTDGIWVGGSLVEDGDYSGPGGGRTVLRHPEVDCAILETARGGMLRRGLAVDRARVALVTNVAEDHLGEFGIDSVEQLARVKLLVTQVIPPDGWVVLNADDPLLVAGARKIAAPIVWYSTDARSPVVVAHCEGGGRAVVLDGGDIVLRAADSTTTLTTLDRVPITLSGAARHNVSNVLGVVAVARSLDLPRRAVARGLARFRPSRRDSPGRLNVFHLGDATVIVDFAHNPHGVTALGETARAMPARRRLILIGQAGDRDDSAIRDLARAAWSMAPDRVVVKEMPKYLRGRRPGEIPAIIERELAAAGAPPGAIDHADCELDGVNRALRWARPGDLLLLTAHEHRTEMLDLMDQLESSGWLPGAPVPRPTPAGQEAGA